eukprot:m.463911 g.463911  ORF g.463911 m.463911 type:complete len:391 (-) comp21613_c0_seq5:98-1270(-)
MWSVSCLTPMACHVSVFSGGRMVKAAAPEQLLTRVQQTYEVVIEIIEAKNLIAGDRSGFSDPYVKPAVVIAEGIEYKLEKTPKIKQTLNPYWGCVREVTLSTEKDDIYLLFEVWDWDRIGRDDFLGRCSWRVPICDIDDTGGVVLDMWLMLEGAPEVTTGELRVLATVALADFVRGDWDPEADLARTARTSHAYDRFGVPLPPALRRPYLSWYSYLAVREMRQLAAWGETLGITNPIEHSREFFRQHKVKELVWLGIPRNRRGEMYLAALAVDSKRFGLASNYYEKLCEASGGIQNQHFIDIDKDVTRTAEGKNTFAATATGRASLKRILKAYALRNPVLGYCQSLSYIVEALMFVLTNEEDIFWCVGAGSPRSAFVDTRPHARTCLIVS